MHRTRAQGLGAASPPQAQGHPQARWPVSRRMPTVHRQHPREASRWTVDTQSRPAEDPLLDEAVARISDLAARLWAVRRTHHPQAVGWRRRQVRLRRLRRVAALRNAAGRPAEVGYAAS